MGREYFSVYTNVCHEVFDWQYVSHISGYITWRFKEEKEDEEEEEEAEEKEKWKIIPLRLVERRMCGRQTERERATVTKTEKDTDGLLSLSLSLHLSFSLSLFLSPV